MRLTYEYTIFGLLSELEDCYPEAFNFVPDKIQARIYEELDLKQYENEDNFLKKFTSNFLDKICSEDIRDFYVFGGRLFPFYYRELEKEKQFFRSAMFKCKLKNESPEIIEKGKLYKTLGIKVLKLLTGYACELCVLLEKHDLTRLMKSI